MKVLRKATARSDYPFWDPYLQYHEITVRRNSKSSYKGKTYFVSLPGVILSLDDGKENSAFPFSRSQESD